MGLALAYSFFKGFDDDTPQLRREDPTKIRVQGGRTLDLAPVPKTPKPTAKDRLNTQQKQLNKGFSSGSIPKTSRIGFDKPSTPVRQDVARPTSLLSNSNVQSNTTNVNVARPAPKSGSQPIPGRSTILSSTRRKK